MNHTLLVNSEQRPSTSGHVICSGPSHLHLRRSKSSLLVAQEVREVRGRLSCLSLPNYFICGQFEGVASRMSPCKSSFWGDTLSLSTVVRSCWRYWRRIHQADNMSVVDDNAATISIKLSKLQGSALFNLSSAL